MNRIEARKYLYNSAVFPTREILLEKVYDNFENIENINNMLKTILIDILKNSEHNIVIDDVLDANGYSIKEREILKEELFK